MWPQKKPPFHTFMDQWTSGIRACLSVRSGQSGSGYDDTIIV